MMSEAEVSRGLGGGMDGCGGNGDLEREGGVGFWGLEEDYHII